MIAALLVVAVGLAASGPVTVWLLLRHLDARDARAQDERERLYQRIQAPETAVAQAVAAEEPTGPLYASFDDDEDYFKTKAEEGQLAWPQ